MRWSIRLLFLRLWHYLWYFRWLFIMNIYTVLMQLGYVHFNSYRSIQECCSEYWNYVVILCAIFLIKHLVVRLYFYYDFNNLVYFHSTLEDIIVENFKNLKKSCSDSSGITFFLGSRPFWCMIQQFGGIVWLLAPFFWSITQHHIYKKKLFTYKTCYSLAFIENM